MRAIIQRVSSASVKVDNVVISQISKGLMVLVGIGRDDTVSDIDILTKKIVSLRIFDDSSSGMMWKKNVKDIDGDILCVSQFTLMGETAKGNKPDFHRAMATELSREMYAAFLDRIGKLHNPDKIKDGKFGAMMSVNLANEGPVTFTLDSRKFEYVDQPAIGGDAAARTSPSSKNNTSTEKAANTVVPQVPVSETASPS